ncbi:MAG: pantoate--beta-alanine ligase [Deltaproteobacteria bacterium]|nr:pantoate--beta-alanine ligase [Deltaproteobacteria bacterium]
MELVTTRNVVRERVGQARAAGKLIGLVPTMGSLHEGHASLMRRGRSRSELLAVSLFVNPLQFGPGEDLSCYPRDLPRDMALCESCGVDLLYAPPPEEVYPPGFASRVEVQRVTEPLCGARRPGHFAGVTTVVLKLFTLLQPHLAFFGEKDYQQLVTIRKMVADLDLDVEVVGLPTVRDSDGLALSSRNTYLSPEQRQQALALPRGLQAASRAHAAGERDARRLEAIARAEIGKATELRIDYLELRDAADLAPLEMVERPAVIAAAVFIGRTRLIDNRLLG